MLIQLAQFMSEQEVPSEDEQIEDIAPSNSEPEEIPETDSVETLNSLQESLKKSRWNVFMFLGLAFLMFAFALFPMPMDADFEYCLLYTSPSPRDRQKSRMPSSA